jgi:acetyl-CoA acetyltransferase
VRVGSSPLADRAIYIAGVAETLLGKVTDHTELSMAALASRDALAEAGLKLKDVDGLFVNYMGEEGSVQVGEYLGIRPRYGDSTDIGGASFEAFIHHAMIAIALGRCEVALITYASRQRSRRGRQRLGQSDTYTLTGQFEAPYGLLGPISHYALLAARRMHEFGITPEQQAEVAVAARRWAQLNPKAWSREPLTIEDVLASPMVSSPYRKLDCCLVTDGGGAVVVTTRERARDAEKTPIRILGAAESHTQWHVSQVPDMTASPGSVAARDAFGMAGVKAGDVDVVEVYDNFTGAVLQHLEDLGFCGRGEAGAFVEGGRLAPGGDIPTMTSGGGLSYCHPGALGILLLIEAVRQLRGEAGDRQVEDARIAVAHGIGGMSHSTSATVVLGRE